MNHFVFSAVVVFLVSAPLGVYFFRSRQPVLKQYGVFLLWIAFWTLTVGFQNHLLPHINDRVWGWFLHLGCISVPPAFFHFTVRLTGHDKKLRAGVWAGWLGVAFFLALNALTNLFTFGTSYRAGYAYPTPAMLYPVYIVYFQVFGLWGTILLIQFRKTLASSLRRHLDVFFVFHVLAYAGAMDNYLIMYDKLFFPLFPYGLYLVAPYMVVGSLVIPRINGTISEA